MMTGGAQFTTSRTSVIMYPMKANEEILERVSSELLPGERIFVFGPGKTPRSRSVTKRDKIALSFFFLFFFSIVAAPEFIKAMNFTTGSYVIAVSVIFLLLLLFAMSVPKVSTTTDDETKYFAITNDRFLQINDSEIQTLSVREKIQKIQRKGNLIRVFVGNRETVITQQDISGNVDFEIRHQAKQS